MSRTGNKRRVGSSSATSLRDVCSHFTDSRQRNLYATLVGMKIEPPFELDWTCLESLNWSNTIRELLPPPWLSLLSQIPPIYKELTAEFLSTFTFNPQARPPISFRLAGVMREMSIATFAIACRLYQPSEVLSDDFQSALTFDTAGAEFDRPVFWKSIAYPGCQEEFFASRSRVSSVYQPIHRLIQKCIARTISPRSQSTGTLNHHDLFYLYCLLHNHPCNVAVEVAAVFHSYHGNNSPARIYNGALVSRLVAHYEIDIDGSIQVENSTRRWHETWLVNNELLNRGPNGVTERMGAAVDGAEPRARQRGARRAPPPPEDARSDREILLGLERTVGELKECCRLMMSRMGVPDPFVQQPGPANPTPLLVIPYDAAGGRGRTAAEEEE